MTIVTIAQMQTIIEYAPYPEDRRIARGLLDAHNRRMHLFNGDSQEIALEMERIPSDSLHRIKQLVTLMDANGAIIR